MSVAAPITENTLFLHAIITSTKCKIDFAAVGVALGLKTGTASMRYQRMRPRLDKTTNAPVASAKSSLDENSLFLYQCIVASDCKPDWNVVGVATGLKSGTASMRWRRLVDRIKKESGPPQPSQIPATAPKSTTPKKRKIQSIKEAAESDDDNEKKKVKTGDDDVPEKRQTRGKKLDLKAMLDGAFSDTASSTGGPPTSIYEESMVKAEDSTDEEMGDDEDEDDSVITKKPTKLSPGKAAAPQTSVKRKPVLKTVKPTYTTTPMTPTSASHSARENPKPTPSIVSSVSGVPPMPRMPTPISPGIIPSIEHDDHAEVAARPNALPYGKYMIPITATPSDSSETYETTAESIPPSATTSTHAQASDGSEADLDDMSSVAPDDSISTIGVQGGLVRKRVSTAKRDGLFGKLWGLFA